MRSPATTLALTLIALSNAPLLRAQHEAGALELTRRSAPELAALSTEARAALDPGRALDAARAMLLRAEKPTQRRDAWLQLGRAWLLAGEPEIALRYAEAIVAEVPEHALGWALRVRALLDAGRAREALKIAENATNWYCRAASFELRAAHASALYRNQRMQEAAKLYRALLSDDPNHSETLIRLGSGLLPAGPAPVHGDLRRAIAEVQSGQVRRAERSLLRLIDRDPAHPIPLRLLGELELQAERLRSPLLRGGFAERLREVLRPRRELGASARRFVPALEQLGERRRAVAERALYYFEPWLRVLEDRGARHDILREDQRCTDAAARRFLRGKRTFDGRLWDDVRGMGGLVAATGIEALDEGSELGFDTLIHELAHQIHLYAFSRRQRARVTELYQKARTHDRCLDKYAASHETEYFAQGVEAFFSFAKCAGQPRTHGHTRFELERVDPELHEFLEQLFRRDPLQDRAARAVLDLALQAALSTGRVEDAAAIAGRLGEEPARLRPRLRRVAQRYRGL